MSNRQFKTLLSNSKYVLFDYGIVDEKPNIDKQLAGVCKYNDIFYIKQRNSIEWIPIIAVQLLINVVYNIDDINDSYWWLYQYNGQEINDQFINDIYSKKSDINNLLIWKHNQDKYIDCSFFRTIDNGQHYRKIHVPYQHIGRNVIIADFNGFTQQINMQNQSFYISCK